MANCSLNAGVSKCRERMIMAIQYGTDEWFRLYEEEVSKRLKTPPPYIFFTPEWITLFQKAIREDTLYQKVAEGWEGTVCLHVEKKPKYGLDVDLYLLLDLWHGDCRSAMLVPPDVGEAADYVITASLDHWIKIGRKELDTVKGMMQRKLKLKGSLPSMVRYVKASNRLTEISAEVGGKFPDELTPEGIEELRQVVRDLGSKLLA